MPQDKTLELIGELAFLCTPRRTPYNPALQDANERAVAVSFDNAVRRIVRGELAKMNVLVAAVQAFDDAWFVASVRDCGDGTARGPWTVAAKEAQRVVDTLKELTGGR
jgi:hypothetical protein